MRGDLLIIFARVPRLGTVKRRLARQIGQRAALDFHRRQVAALLGSVARDRRWRSVLAATPDRARHTWPRRVTVIAQGHGDLGRRMARALSRARRAVLVGSDIPGIGATDIAAAFRALGRADAVFGPSADGGYWLVGMGPRRPARPFATVRWSTAQALDDTLGNFRGRRVALLRELRDVDGVADLVALGLRYRPIAHR